jgi:hypothetical protein
MRPSLLLTLAAALYASACTKGTDASRQVTRSIGTVLWPKKEDALVTTLQKRQEANLVRLAQQRAMEQAAAEQAAAELAAAERAYKRKKSRGARKVPPSMYRTAEPPLPEPDLSLPIQEIPRSAPRDN